MDLDKLIEQKIRESRIYGVTKPLVIKDILNIPDDIDIKNLDKFIDSYYDTFYIKKEWAKQSPSKEQKYRNFLNIEKELEK